MSKGRHLHRCHNNGIFYKLLHSNNSQRIWIYPVKFATPHHPRLCCGNFLDAFLRLVGRPNPAPLCFYHWWRPTCDRWLHHPALPRSSQGRTSFANRCPIPGDLLHHQWKLHHATTCHCLACEQFKRSSQAVIWCSSSDWNWQYRGYYWLEYISCRPSAILQDWLCNWPVIIAICWSVVHRLFLRLEVGE